MDNQKLLVKIIVLLENILEAQKSHTINYAAFVLAVIALIIAVLR